MVFSIPIAVSQKGKGKVKCDHQKDSVPRFRCLDFLMMKVVVAGHTQVLGRKQRPDTLAKCYSKISCNYSAMLLTYVLRYNVMLCKF